MLGISPYSTTFGAKANTQCGSAGLTAVEEVESYGDNLTHRSNAAPLTSGYDGSVIRR